PGGRAHSARARARRAAGCARGRDPRTVRRERRRWVSQRTARGRERPRQRPAARGIRSEQRKRRTAEVPPALRGPTAPLRGPPVRVADAYARTDRELLQG